MSDRWTFDHALGAYQAAERPPLCPRCGGWDGPRLPFCTNAGYSHQGTCAKYTFALDICADCTRILERPQDQIPTEADR